MSLKTDYVDEILQEGEQRKYNLIDNNGATLYSNVRLEKVYTPKQYGTKFSAEDVNSITKSINDITDGMSMSLAEKYTGRKWYDGKKIYCKVIQWKGIQTGTVGTSHNIENVKEFIDYGVIIKGDDAFYKLPINYYSSSTSGTFYSVYARLTNDSIYIISNSTWSNYDCTAVIYYTKTTD